MPTKKELDKLFEDELKLDILATQKAFRLSRKVAAELRAENEAELKAKKEVRSPQSIVFPLKGDKIRKKLGEKDHRESRKALQTQRPKLVH